MQGNTRSVNITTNLTKQMSDAGGDVAIIAGSISTMIEGERNLKKLTADISEQGQRLITGILAQMTILET